MGGRIGYTEEFKLGAHHTRDPRLSLIRQTNIFHLKADIFKGVRQGGLVG